MEVHMKALALKAVAMKSDDAAAAPSSVVGDQQQQVTVISVTAAAPPSLVYAQDKYLPESKNGTFHQVRRMSLPSELVAGTQ